MPLVGTMRQSCSTWLDVDDGSPCLSTLRAAALLGVTGIGRARLFTCTPPSRYGQNVVCSKETSLAARPRQHPTPSSSGHVDGGQLVGSKTGRSISSES